MVKTLVFVSLVAAGGTVAYVAHETHRNVLDVSARDVSNVVKDRAPVVVVDKADGSITFRQVR